ncbi:CinA family protein [Bifidobacterium imperatoris]|uniref:CinA family protein n=1 Tax=Bifidobacterium imperatoris TaxID=2020965 RepID=A0A2N5IVB6_9BIFI|nr:nicotinamide-nucleotide amidohydrolase family protein [Bifidobacterium imperatoris]PLS25909.1 damage-inducible protein CinA [Bifidobacterium imperatoris]QSY57619.1 CinA family protein [Bifidobacterium imperatoris]
MCNTANLDSNQLRQACDDVAARILKICEVSNVKIACAESLTGGLLADAFVRIPGASNVFLGSAVTYDIKAKASVLGVDRDLLEREGAVHPEVARQMAAATAQLYDQSEYCRRVIGLSTTGVAGPGPDGDKPAGLVYIGFCIPAGLSAARAAGVEPRIEAVELRLSGTREEVREQTILNVLQHLSTLLL